MLRIDDLPVFNQDHDQNSPEPVVRPNLAAGEFEPPKESLVFHMDPGSSDIALAQGPDWHGGVVAVEASGCHGMSFGRFLGQLGERFRCQPLLMALAGIGTAPARTLASIRRPISASMFFQ